VASESTDARGTNRRTAPGLDADADVVVVSGVPRTVRDGALPDLAAEFLRAGARSVVLPLWPVDAAPDRRFAGAVRDALSAGASASEAARRAVEAVRERFPSPRHWGGWCVFGSGGPLEEVS
jgi:CHAT domain-containing protein